jgi:hypothetical protein
MIRMVNSVPTNAAEKFNKESFIGQSTPVAHPIRRMIPSNVSDVGTDRWGFISERPSMHDS